MIEIFTSPIFYILITITLFCFLSNVYKKTKIAILHPLITTSTLLIIYIYLISILNNNDKLDELVKYNNSLNIINLMLGPLIIALAIPIYKNWLILKKYWALILISSIIGTAVSISSVYILGTWLKLDNTLIISLIPKSVTTAIAKEIAINIGGIPEITIAAVIFTGILGSTLGPLLTKIFKLNDWMSSGLSFGIASHAVGTSKAMEISLEAGAISSIAIATTGILTMIVCVFI